jgi:hypothetical protein
MTLQAQTALITHLSRADKVIAVKQFNLVIAIHNELLACKFSRQNEWTSDDSPSRPG